MRYGTVRSFMYEFQVSASITCRISRITYAIPKSEEQRMLHSSSHHRAVIPSHTCAAERCSGSADYPFLKAPRRALSSFRAATSDKRVMDKGGSYPGTVNQTYENFPQIFPASDSRARCPKEKVMSRR